ncbi:hypothetical protein SEA_REDWATTLEHOG_153 [Gordonia phage RedWattleHog]|uniref:Uncharacterized protein n=1 Tax=Gordonia phage Stormageddon TaxID=2656541 RepID=A0A649VS43_9CAUD|nr:hypothetical protein KHQ86_gp146 [Gordonia phage Stormageddon]QGJ95014.1 hypothetical protein SEA_STORMAGEDDON_154 [Gordonia phage Stormageddon]QLF83656.1 hypothetical protein SEA_REDWATTLEHOG_153 [Gordonia phage RedWattleHog]
MATDRVVHGMAVQQHYLERVSEAAFGGWTGGCTCRWTMAAGSKSWLVTAHRAHVSEMAEKLSLIRGTWEAEWMPRGTVLISERTDLPFVWQGEGQPCSVLHPDQPAHAAKGDAEDLFPATVVWVPREK